MSGFAPKRRAAIIRALTRLAMVALFAFAVANILRHSNAWLARHGGLAGFGTGMLHGALMPGALPGLLFGRDIPIYAEQNNGIPYKLGYTVGVNACGALFFGWTFWRLNRWRKLLRSEPSSASQPTACPQSARANEQF